MLVSWCLVTATSACPSGLSIAHQAKSPLYAIVGLEKTLRLCQNFAEVVMEWTGQDAVAQGARVAREHLLLTRRYFRYTKFIDCGRMAAAKLNGRDKNETDVVMVLEVGRWSCMGMYLFLEAFTIVSYVSCCFVVQVTFLHCHWFFRTALGNYSFCWVVRR